MRKIVILASVILLTVFCAKADPPKKVNLTYQDGKLKVEVVHKVSDPQKHYINQIVINVDGVDVKTITPSAQASKDSQVEEVALDLKKGSKVKVIARCSKFGTKAVKMTVE